MSHFLDNGKLQEKSTRKLRIEDLSSSGLSLERTARDLEKNSRSSKDRKTTVRFSDLDDSAHVSSRESRSQKYILDKSRDVAEETFDGLVSSGRRAEDKRHPTHIFTSPSPDGRGSKALEGRYRGSSSALASYYDEHPDEDVDVALMIGDREIEGDNKYYRRDEKLLRDAAENNIAKPRAKSAMPITRRSSSDHILTREVQPHYTAVKSGLRPVLPPHGDVVNPTLYSPSGGRSSKDGGGRGDKG